MEDIKFNNSYDLINYLCREDVLGELEVAFFQLRSSKLEPTFNFSYPELEEHLYEIFEEWPSFYGSTISGLNLKFSNAEDVEEEVKNDLEFVEHNLSDLILFISDYFEKKCSKECYLIVEIEGEELELDQINVKEFEIYEYQNDEEPLKIDQEDKNVILEKILEEILNINTEIERSCLSSFSFQMRGEEIDYFESGNPADSYGYYNLQDGVSFKLNTGLLKKN